MIRVAIECDQCGERPVQTVQNGKHAIYRLRTNAAAHGWTHRKNSGKDYCPSCSKSRIAQPKE